MNLESKFEKLDGSKPSLADTVIDWRRYQQSPTGNRNWPSIYSLQWFIRQNRRRLIKANALIKLRGRDYIIPEIFEKEMISIGSFAAHSSLRAKE